MLTLWRPHRELSRLSREFDDFFNWKAPNGEAPSFTPAVDIEEKADRFVLRADLPGLSAKDVDIRVKDEKLLLSGKREEATEKEKEGYFYRERRTGSFSRQFELGSTIASDKISAPLPGI